MRNMLDSKLNKVLKDLAPLAKQGKGIGFLTSADDADKLSGMVNDIRDAMMEYQVCRPWTRSSPSLTTTPDFVAARSLP
jgi:hypothetical protein